MLPLLLALALTSPDPAPAPSAPPATLAQADEDLPAEDFGDDLPPPPPPLPDGDEAEDGEGDADAGEEVAPPPPPPLPTADPADGTAPPPLEPAQPSAPSAAGPTKPVKGALAAAITAAGGLATAGFAGGCCACCNIFGCWAPPVCGAVGSGGSAIAGAMLAGVPLTDALLPALGAAGMGLLGGLVAMPCGVATSAAVLTVLTGRFDVASGTLLSSGPTQLAAAASGIAVTLVMVAGSVSAGGLTWMLLPDEVPVETSSRPKAVRAPAEAPVPDVRAVRAVAY